MDQLATLWFEAWNDAHARLVPAELRRLRTRESFRDRLAAMQAAIRVIGEHGSPVGFCVVKSDELYQLFVAAPARGSGIATALIADAESRLAAAGVATAWLACAIGNARAARFYEKCGWQLAGVVEDTVETTEGDFVLQVWRYEKRLRTADASRADVS